MSKEKQADAASMGPIEAASEGVKLSVSAFRRGLGAVWDEAAPMFNMGRAEIAAAMFNGSAYVMYPRAELEMQQQREKDQELGM